MRQGHFKLLIVTMIFVSAAITAEELVEQYVSVPMPPGFQVESTELEGPVFADANGRTIYTWPSHKQRNGYSGETQGNPACYDEVLTVTAGLMSPYPPGILLPELDSRPSCTDLWPPVFADEDARALDNWTIIDRKDGSRQWAYDEQPLYTSVRDSEAGDVLGGTTRRYGGDSPANRIPLAPPSKVPPGFAVKTTTVGRLLTNDNNYSVYAYEADRSDASLCDLECTRTWKPVPAPALARATGEWSTLERSPGVRQWVFRGKPLYTYVLDQHSWSQEGSDVDGWSNVYTQMAHPTCQPRMHRQNSSCHSSTGDPPSSFSPRILVGLSMAGPTECDSQENRRRSGGSCRPIHRRLRYHEPRYTTAARRKPIACCRLCDR